VHTSTSNQTCTSTPKPKQTQNSQAKKEAKPVSRETNKNPTTHQNTNKPSKTQAPNSTSPRSPFFFASPPPSLHRPATFASPIRRQPAVNPQATYEAPHLQP